MATITAAEEKALVQFKEQIADVLRNDHDDDTLVKWLRARRLRVNDSEAMYRKSMEWRKDNKADSLLTSYQEPEVMRKYWTGGVCGCDKEGRPVQIDCFGKLDLKGVCSSLPRHDVIKCLVYRMELQLQHLKQESKSQGKLVNQVVLILDMDGFGRKHMWIPGAELITDLLRTLDNNYPEMLHKTYIINAPRMFHYAFSFIKGFLSEDTRNKFGFLGSNWKAELLKLIDADQLPVHFGGSKTDAEGDEYCQSLISTGGEVPAEYYMATEDLEREKKCTSVIVKKGDSHRVDVVVKSNGVIKWYMRSDRDLGFGIVYKENVTSEESVIQPVTWTHCSKFAHYDTQICQEPGIYTFVFDNSDSWWHDRKVRYHLEIEELESMEKHLVDRLSEVTKL